ncbi:hypothetical protein AAG570_012136 [Ranatra chinensis]|uniref:cGMP-dependent protein kinase interacting domain-containing protein n=1 Tax=Ranatra chinensis TaxID=642074 RepID=A0ABD0YHY5_9HEMI
MVSKRPNMFLPEQEAEDNGNRFYRRYLELRAKINAGNSCPTLHSTPTRSASLKEKHYVRSFVPPVRDEESETQRKAHAKRVRETRRSTQGVTLEEIKSAEQLVKKKQQQQQQQQQTNSQVNNEQQPAAAAVAAEDVVVNVHKVVERTPVVADTVSATLTRSSEGGNNLGEKRPSWRLKVDNGSKFMLEDARSGNEQDVGHIRRAVVTPVTETGDTTVTIPLRRNRTDEKVQDKENDTKTAQATQAVIQRRKRPKRRSTGVPLVGMDDLDPDRNSESVSGGEYQKLDELTMVNSIESGTEKPSRSSSDLDSTVHNKEAESTTENGEIDYKKLYEESMVENERLREKLRHVEDDLTLARSQAEKNAIQHKNSLSEVEKRERRAMERKLSEMEEELKQLQKLKADNERLRAENRALTRVVSNLTATHKKW